MKPSGPGRSRIHLGISLAILAVGVGATLLPGAAGCSSARGGRPTRHEAVGALSGAPPVILWAWQRPSDLSFIDPKRVGVSFLVETIRMGSRRMAIERNQNGLRIPEGTWLMACARIEMEPGYVPTPLHEESRALASLLAPLARFPGAKAVQIDFDATVSQRDFYRALLTDLRHRLPPSMPLSITALASWCEGDDWVSGLPVNEAVPMLFRMGADRRSILLRLQSGDDFEEPLCRKSAGISTDESVPHLRAARLYIFNTGGWTKTSFEAIMSSIPE